MFKVLGIFISLLVSLPIDAFSIEAETLRMNVYRRGEVILGEEFIAANEQIVDYLATLERPSAAMEMFRYSCSVKSRLIRPSFYQINSTATDRVEGWVQVRMVYEIKDCARVSD